MLHDGPAPKHFYITIAEISFFRFSAFLFQHAQLKGITPANKISVRLRTNESAFENRKRKTIDFSSLRCSFTKKKLIQFSCSSFVFFSLLSPFPSLLSSNLKKHRMLVCGCFSLYSFITFHCFLTCRGFLEYFLLFFFFSYCRSCCYIANTFRMFLLSLDFSFDI